MVFHFLEVVETLSRDATVKQVDQLNLKADVKSSLNIIQDPMYRRLCSTIDVKAALLIYTDDIMWVVCTKCFVDIALHNGYLYSVLSFHISRKVSKSTDAADVMLMAEIVADFRQRVSFVCQQKTSEMQAHMDSAVENVIQGVMYRYISDHGPKIPQVTTAEPLVH